jgi:hypothetical protein
MMRIAVVAATVASCAHDAANPPAAPSPPPPRCVALAPPPPPEATPEISEGPPRVESVEPTEGTTAGGEQISILGGGFVPGKTQAEVRFGRKKAPVVTIAATNRILVVTPPGDEGPVDITVSLDDGTEFKIPIGFRYRRP